MIIRLKRDLPFSVERELFKGREYEVDQVVKKHNGNGRKEKIWFVFIVCAKGKQIAVYPTEYEYVGGISEKPTK